MREKYVIHRNLWYIEFVEYRKEARMNPNLTPYENYRHWKSFFLYQAETPQFSSKAEQELIKKYRLIWIEQQIAFDPPKEAWDAKRSFILRRRAGELPIEPRDDLVGGESKSK